MKLIGIMRISDCRIIGHGGRLEAMLAHNDTDAR